MSRESQEIFHQEIRDYQAAQVADPGTEPDAEPLRAAATGHLGASRELAELLAEYAAAMENYEDHTPEQAAAAQRIADELAPVRAAVRVTTGGLPRLGG